MKKIFATMALIVAIATSAAAMNSREIRSTARMMTDRMTMDLRLTRHQEAMVYNINLRYIKRIAVDHDHPILGVGHKKHINRRCTAFRIHFIGYPTPHIT